jgi:hypothetical protein
LVGYGNIDIVLYIPLVYGWASGRVYFMAWDYTDGTNWGVDVNQEGLGKMGEREDYMERKDYMKD